MNVKGMYFVDSISQKSIPMDGAYSCLPLIESLVAWELTALTRPKLGQTRSTGI